MYTLPGLPWQALLLMCIDKGRRRRNLVHSCLASLQAHPCCAERAQHLSCEHITNGAGHFATPPLPADQPYLAAHAQARHCFKPCVPFLSSAALATQEVALIKAWQVYIHSKRPYYVERHGDGMHFDFWETKPQVRCALEARHGRQQGMHLCIELHFGVHCGRNAKLQGAALVQARMSYYRVAVCCDCTHENR